MSELRVGWQRVQECDGACGELRASNHTHPVGRWDEAVWDHSEQAPMDASRLPAVGSMHVVHNKGGKFSHGFVFTQVDYERKEGRFKFFYTQEQFDQWCGKKNAAFADLPQPPDETI